MRSSVSLLSERVDMCATDLNLVPRMVYVSWYEYPEGHTWSTKCSTLSVSCVQVLSILSTNQLKEQGRMEANASLRVCRSSLRYTRS